MEYLFFQNGQTRGPFTIDALRSMRITPDTLVLPQGMTQWIPAGQVEELRSLFTEQPVSPPPLPSAAATPSQQTDSQQPVNDERAQTVQDTSNTNNNSSTANSNHDYSNNFVWWILGIILVAAVILGILSGSDSASSSSQSTLTEDSYDNVTQEAPAVKSEGIVEETAEEEKTEETVNSAKYDLNQTYSVKGVDFKMIIVEGGTFFMGATPEQKNFIGDDEKPVHEVSLSSFSIGETEVTQLLWMAVMGDIPKHTPSHFIGHDLPVVYVSWDDCQTFISKLNAMTEGQRPSGREFRLPTEAEWEFAARGGNKGSNTQFAGSNTQSAVAWYNDNSKLRPHPVGTKISNELGIYDMSGNVFEWCQDWYRSDYYSKSPSTNPCNNNNPTSREERVYRGGDYFSGAGELRVASRCKNEPEYGRPGIGFRLAI